MSRLFTVLSLLAISTPSLAQNPTGATPGSLPAAPRPILRSALAAAIDKEFAMADLNRDGQADRAELEAAEMRILQAQKATLLRSREAAFHRLDSNKNGVLTLQEFNAVAAAAPPPSIDVSATLARFDVNKDGRISVAENRVQAIANFDRLDTNRDGVLGVDEQRPRQGR